MKFFIVENVVELNFNVNVGKINKNSKEKIRQGGGGSMIC
jgi:hypothetical protein